MAFVLKHQNPFRLQDSEVTTMAESGEGNRMEEARAQVGEVVDVMRVNVEKVLERDSKLSDLNSRADNLQAGANQFQTQVNFIFSTKQQGLTLNINQATRLKRKYWWQNMKMMMIIGVVVLIILIIIIVSATSGG